MEFKQTILNQLSMGRNIFVIHGGRHMSHPVYTNDCYMAAYIAHGSGTLKFFEQEETVSVFENDVFLVNPNAPYKFYPIKGLRRIDVYFCYFSLDAVRGFYNTIISQFPEQKDFFSGREVFIRASDSDNKEIRDIFIRMIDEQMSGLPCGYEIIGGYLQILLPKILRSVKTHDFKRIYSKNRIVDEAIRYIQGQMYSGISVDKLSSHLHISASYLCRIFKKHTGLNTSQFINILRVEKIKDMLRSTDKPIEAIPEMFNYNADYLRAIFKKETGMSMREYKEKYNYKHNPLDKEGART